MKELLGENMAFSVPELEQKFGSTGSKTTGSEDFAYVSCEVPSIMAALAAGHPKDGYTYPLHHPQVRFDETALPYGAAAYAAMAYNWLLNHTD
jgi:hippurate hydrolase